MKKYYLALFLVFMITLPAMSQGSEQPWTRSGVLGLNLSQVALSNWSAGGDPSLAIDFNFGYSCDFRKGKNLWNSRLELAYGTNHTKSNGTRKTSDRIFMSSTYGYQVAPKWYATMFMTFQTQFDKGFNYADDPNTYISKFMAPGYLTAGIGMLWTPDTWLNVTLSPAAWRGTFVLDDRLSDQGAFGVDPGKRLRNEFGANVIAEAKLKLMENMDLYSRLNLFSNYLEKPQNVDVQWDIQLNMKVNKWVSASLTLNMIYDDDIRTYKNGDPQGGGAKLQFKEVLGVGMQVQF